MPGVPSAFQYGPTVFVPPASAKQPTMGLANPSSQYHQQHQPSYGQHTYGTGKRQVYITVFVTDVTKQYVDICTCEFIPGYVCKCPVHLLFFPSTSHLILIIQPLMTCLKLTGSTVKEVTEALPSHSPSQRAAAQGKVHTYFYTLTAHNMWPQ